MLTIFIRIVISFCLLLSGVAFFNQFGYQGNSADKVIFGVLVVVFAIGYWYSYFKMEE